MKKIINLLFLSILFSSCSVFSTLNSTTTIKPKDSFILGNNEHGKFKVALKNISKIVLQVYRAPINGGTHSYLTVQPNESVTVRVESNTALVIKNETNDTVDVTLKVKGDLGLSMTYKN